MGMNRLTPATDLGAATGSTGNPAHGGPELTWTGRARRACSHFAWRSGSNIAFIRSGLGNWRPVARPRPAIMAIIPGSTLASIVGAISPNECNTAHIAEKNCAIGFY